MVCCLKRLEIDEKGAMDVPFIKKGWDANHGPPALEAAALPPFPHPLGRSTLAVNNRRKKINDYDM